MLEKVATMKWFEYSPLGKELKAQTDIAKKQHQGLDKVFISNKDDKDINVSFIKKEKKYDMSNIIRQIFISSKFLWWFSNIY